MADEKGNNIRGSALLDKVINAISDSIYAKDTEGRYLTVNATGARMLGYGIAEVLGRTDYELVGSEARYWMEQDRAVMRSGEPLSYENSTVIDNEARFFHTRKMPLLANDGSVAGVIGISQEITRLRDAESQYRFIFEYAPVALWEEDFSGVASILNVMRSEGVHDLSAQFAADQGLLLRMVDTITVLDVNREALRLSGLTAKPGSMSDLRKVLNPESQSLFAKQFISLFEGELMYRTETSIITPNGIKDVLFQLNVLPGHEVDLKKVLIAVVDVTAMKRTARELEELRELYRSVVDRQTELICRFGPDGKLKLANEAFKAYFGGTPARFHDVFPEDQQSRVCDHCKLITPDSGPTSMESYAYGPDGGLKWQQWTISALFTDDEATIYQAVGKDVTDQRQAEEELAASEERWRSLFANVQDGIMTVNSKGIILSANQAAQSRTEVRLPGLKIHDLITDDEVRNTASAKLDRMFSTGEAQTFDVSVNLSGGPQHFSCLFSPVLSKGKVVSANIQVRDVTHIREGERKVREALVEGQDAERKRISRELHDGLGQVFTAMKLSLQNMQGAEKHPCPDIMGQWLKEFEGLVDRSIAEVKTISRNLSPDILTRYGLRAAIEDTVERVASTSKAGIDLQFVEFKEKYDSHIESSVFRMFQELLTNALTHSQAQTINVQLIDHGDSLVLTVEDNGRGYDPDTVVNGLGLPHVLSRAELLGGRVDVETRPGKGTLTTVEIPIA